MLMKCAGPTRKKPIETNTQPNTVIHFGSKLNLSKAHPQQGAVTAYTPPLMMNMRPSTTGDNSN